MELYFLVFYEVRCPRFYFWISNDGIVDWRVVILSVTGSIREHLTYWIVNRGESSFLRIKPSILRSGFTANLLLHLPFYILVAIMDSPDICHRSSIWLHFECAEFFAIIRHVDTIKPHSHFRLWRLSLKLYAVCLSVLDLNGLLVGKFI